MAENSFPSIAFIGAGVMAEVMIKGLLLKQVVTPSQVSAAAPRQERVNELCASYQIFGATSNLEVAQNASIVVLAVKPQSLAKVLRELKGHLRPDQLVVSIIAGARMKRIGSALGHPAVVRCMPNLPCQILKGMTIWTASKEVATEQRELVKRMLRTMGREFYVEDELDVDRATAVNGTGPAIIAYFVKSLEDAANYIGESRPLARQSVLQTIIGTAEMILASEKHVADLIDGVTSPGGTTSRALHVLAQGRMSSIVTDSINAAFQRSLELGRLLDEQVEATGD